MISPYYHHTTLFASKLITFRSLEYVPSIWSIAYAVRSNVEADEYMNISSQFGNLALAVALPMQASQAEVDTLWPVQGGGTLGSNNSTPVSVLID